MSFEAQLIIVFAIIIIAVIYFVWRGRAKSGSCDDCSDCSGCDFCSRSEKKKKI